MWWGAALGVGGGCALAWLLLLLLMWRLAPDQWSVKAALRLLPDVLILLRRLAADRTLPRGVRIRLWSLLIYLAVPVDLVPDVIPVIGYADDAILIIAVLRSVARRAGPDAIHQHWSGTPQGLSAVLRLVAGPAAGRGAPSGE